MDWPFKSQHFINMVNPFHYRGTYANGLRKINLIFYATLPIK